MEALCCSSPRQPTKGTLSASTLRISFVFRHNLFMADARTAKDETLSGPGAGRNFVLVLLLFLATVTSVPYVLGSATGWEGSSFDGVLTFREDTHAYMAFARQAWEGKLLFANPFAVEPHDGALFNIEWLVLGWLGAVFGVLFEGAPSLLLGLHAVRLLGIVLLVLSLNRWCRTLFSSAGLARIALLAVLFGGGFGWWMSMPSLLPSGHEFRLLDLWAGVHPFFWMLLAPHFLVAQALTLFALWYGVRATRNGGSADGKRAAALAFLVGLVRPFDAAVLAGTSILFAFTGGREWRRRLFLLAGAAPPLLYQAWLFTSHPTFAAWGEQNIALPPQPGSLAAALGLMAVAFPLVLGRWMRKGPAGGDPGRLLACAFLSALFLLYAYPPLRFTFQVLPALAMPLTLVVLVTLGPGLETWRQKSALASPLLGVLLLFHGGDALHLWGQAVDHARGPVPRIETSVLDAYTWLDREALGGAVLTTADHGGRLPAYASVSTFCGYRYATPDWRARYAETEAFFSPWSSEEDRRGLLTRWGITHLLVDVIREEHSRLDLGEAPFLEEVFRNDQVAIYAVKGGG